MHAIQLTALLGAAAIGLSIPGAANAATIISTFDAGHSYNCCIGWTISGPDAPISFVLGSANVANGFTSPGNFRISQIDLGLGNLSGSNTSQVSLWTDSGGLPGTMTALWTVGGLPAFNSTTTQLTTIGGITGVNLRAGADYFLVITPGAADTWNAWNWNTIGATGLHLIQIDGGAWTSREDDPLGAFEITGIAIPEPATLSLLGFGLAGFAIRRRKTPA